MCLYRLKANSLTCNREMFLKKVQVTLLTFFAACFKAAGRWTVILDLTGLPAMAWKRAHIRTVSFYNVSKTCSTLQLCLWLCFEIVGLLNDSILGSFREKNVSFQHHPVIVSRMLPSVTFMWLTSHPIFCTTSLLPSTCMNALGYSKMCCKVSLD